jgi:hypothetical protein
MTNHRSCRNRELNPGRRTGTVFLHITRICLFFLSFFPRWCVCSMKEEQGHARAHAFPGMYSILIHNLEFSRRRVSDRATTRSNAFILQVFVEGLCIQRCQISHIFVSQWLTCATSVTPRMQAISAKTMQDNAISDSCTFWLFVVFGGAFSISCLNKRAGGSFTSALVAETDLKVIITVLIWNYSDVILAPRAAKYSCSSESAFDLAYLSSQKFAARSVTVVYNQRIFSSPCAL